VFHPEAMHGVAAVMCSHAASVPVQRAIEADVYAEGPLDLGENAAVRAAFGAGDVLLGKNSRVLRWLHANGSVYLREGSAAHGRLSAGRSICLERGCNFEHMQAPQILTVDFDGGVAGMDWGGARELTTHVCKADEETNVEDALEAGRRRLRIPGDFVLPAGETLHANIITTGELRFESRSRLFGSVKSYKDTVLAEDACVHGSIVCGETVRVGERCFVAGPVMAERDVLIGRGSQIGKLDAPTTVSSHGAQIAAGCQLYGTVWARERGNIAI
jgi:predicted acyltransferase (DUF342 family)